MGSFVSKISPNILEKSLSNKDFTTIVNQIILSGNINHITNHNSTYIKDSHNLKENQIIIAKYIFNHIFYSQLFFKKDIICFINELLKRKEFIELNTIYPNSKILSYIILVLAKNNSSYILSYIMSIISNVENKYIYEIITNHTDNIDTAKLVYSNLSYDIQKNIILNFYNLKNMIRNKNFKMFEYIMNDIGLEHILNSV
jgi:hypothetical protein